MLTSVAALSLRARASVEAARDVPVVDVVVPVYNEATALVASIRRLHAYLRDSFPFSFRITIADNGSVDGTWLARDLEGSLAGVRAVRLAAAWVVTGAGGRGMTLAPAIAERVLDELCA